jgi:hypothetical protein
MRLLASLCPCLPVYSDSTIPGRTFVEFHIGERLTKLCRQSCEGGGEGVAEREMFYLTTLVSCLGYITSVVDE